MWNDTASVVRSQLNPGETLLWSGQPRKGIVFRASDAVLIPFSLLWGGFAIFWQSAAIKSGDLFFMMWGIPFVLVGLQMIFGRFVVEAKQRGKTYYAVSNEHAIIVSGWFSRKVTSLNLKTLSDVSLEEKADGSGTITFGSSKASWDSRASRQDNWGRWPFGRRLSGPGFEMIQEARKVYEIIRGVQH